MFKVRASKNISNLAILSLQAVFDDIAAENDLSVETIYQLTLFDLPGWSNAFSSTYKPNHGWPLHGTWTDYITGLTMDFWNKLNLQPETLTTWIDNFIGSLVGLFGYVPQQNQDFMNEIFYRLRFFDNMKDFTYAEFSYAHFAVNQRWFTDQYQNVDIENINWANIFNQSALIDVSTFKPTGLQIGLTAFLNDLGNVSD